MLAEASLPSSGIAKCLHGPERFIMLMTVSREIAITATVMVLASRSNIMQLPAPVRWTVSVPARESRRHPRR